MNEYKINQQGEKKFLFFPTTDPGFGANVWL